MDFNNEKAVEIYGKKTGATPVEESIFNQYLKDPVYILDMGCGTGRTSRVLADMGHSVLGVDISPLMIERAKELHPDVWFRVGDATDIKYSDNTFDVVLFSFNGIDYIYPEPERVKAIREIYRVLKPGGMLIYSSHDASKMKALGRTRNWRRRPRPYKGLYFIEKMVYGDLVTYYSSKSRNINTLQGVGFVKTKFYDLGDKVWRYYIAWK